jgi:hypothetical protein
MGWFALQTTILSPKQSRLAQKEFVIMVFFHKNPCIIWHWILFWVTPVRKIKKKAGKKKL